MKKLLVFGAALAFATAGMAQKNSELDTIGGKHLFPAKGQSVYAGGGGGGSSLSYYGGKVIVNAKVVAIFWTGSNLTSQASFGTSASPSVTANHIMAMLNFFGGSGEYNTITQYYQKINNVQTNIQLPGVNWESAVWDTSALPSNGNVTDSLLQGRVKALVNAGGDTSTVYEVFLPKVNETGASVYSSDGSSDSCGGPSLAYCAYHGAYLNGSGQSIKYASIPYPSCSGCTTSGWTDAQNFEHFVSHETREAVTDPDQYSGGTQTWRDARGYEADDKCAWSPTPFLQQDGGNSYGFQYEWSNANKGCVKTK